MSSTVPVVSALRSQLYWRVVTVPFPGKLRWLLLAALICALLTVPLAWNARRMIYPDGLSYIEIARNAAELSPRFLLSNAYWSPAYPAVLTVMLKVFNPSAASELAAVHATDWLICCATCLCFTWFFWNLLQWLARRRAGIFGSTTGFCAIVLFAYTLLLIGNSDSSMWFVTPDMLLEGIVYLAAAACLRLSLPDSRRIHYAALGVILAVGYATKAAMFPLALVLLALIFLRPPVRNGGRQGAIIATATFFLAASPLIVSLSINTGHFTYSDAGRLNYAWLVNDVPPWTFLGGGASSGTPRHPVETITTLPTIVKVAGPATATFPFWYDPSYWYDGIQLGRFQLRQQLLIYLGSLGLNAHGQHDGTNLRDLAGRWLPLFAGIAVMILMGLRASGVWQALYSTHIWLVLWPPAAILMYGSLVLQYRYLVPFIVIGWIGLFVAAAAATDWRKSDLVILAVVFALILSGFRALASPGLMMARELTGRSRQTISAGLDHWALARKLEALGIRKGDDLATLQWPGSPYYAHLAGARIDYVLVDDPATLAQLPPERMRGALEMLRAAGVRAIIAGMRSPAPPFEPDGPWIPVPETMMYIRFLN